MSLFEILICICLVSISAFMSSSEIALFSLTRFQLRSLKERFKTSHRRVRRLLADPAGLLVTTLVANEVVNIALSALITRNVSQREYAGVTWLTEFGLPHWIVEIIWGTLITTPIVLFFCEITPKVIAARANLILAPLTSAPLSLIYDLFKPIRIVLKKIVSTVAQRLSAGRTDPFRAIEESQAPLLRENEFLSMIEEGQKEGAVQQTEVGLIKNVFDLDDTQVSEVYTPLARVYSIPSGTPVKAALLNMRGKKYSRIPVITPDRKKILGLLYAKDLLFSRLDSEMAQASVDELVRKPFTVGPTMRLNVLFRRMREQKIHLAIVENPNGDAIGVVTMDDILDELLEDILPADQSPKREVTK